MKLPSLPDLDFFGDDENEKETKSNSKSNDNGKAKEKKKVKEKEKIKKKKPRVPKTEYDNEGNPKLAIPDLNDADLSNEIDRILGDDGG